MNITIREATTNDATALVEHIRRLSDEPDIFILLWPGEFRTTAEEQEGILATFAASDTSHYLVAESDSQLIGHLACKGGMRQATRHSASLSMGVHSEWRGHGVGTALLQEAVNWGRNNPIIRRLELDVIADNTTAIRMYERVGFEIEGRRRQSVWRDDRCYDDLLMGLLMDA